MDRFRDVLARLPLALAVGFGVLCVVLPLGAMLSETVYGPDGFTLEPWATILATDVDRQQILASVGLGVVAVAVAIVFGFGHAWLTTATDLPGARVLGPLGIAPLVIPPILVAMGFADFAPASGFWFCALLLGTSYAPFVAVMTARGLRAVDGRGYEAAMLSRGRGPAERLLLRSILPEIVAGCLFAFLFVISEHGVPEFLTVKGKAWHTYAEGVFGRWTRRATGVAHEDIVSPIVAAVPLIVITALALFVALRFRAHSALRSDFRPLPVRALGVWRFPALVLPATYLTCGVGVPIFVMLRWAMGSTQTREPMSVDILRRSFRGAIEQSGDDLSYTLLLALLTTAILLAVSIPAARVAARRFPAIDHLAVLPVAVPAVLLAIGFVKVFNSPAAGAVYDAVGYDLYDSMGVVGCAYAARFLPFGVLTLSQAVRRLPRSAEDAALLSGRSSLACGLRIHLPALAPAIWSVACLAFVLAARELDVAVVLPAGNDTVVRRLSNIVHFGGEDAGGALALILLVAVTSLPILTVLLTGRKLRPLS
ncbi:MAG: ABC transporter permease subunit [Planctomycetota bacterium]|nr:ABC transporter permease subunit [Planctomycetota bacterium]MDA0932931.1 ABC transporter permease subunit [Planctomycetota bacterium]